ncbi:FecR domain-containing protein [Tistrella sp. BH-R2-4]|uniref:FecR domain-containing protein n=1 Tax=Tistrella arctica TaxID=3133430 RepID=A0ABU9YN18_9PROT
MTGPLPPQTAADWLVVLLDAPDDAGLAAAFARWHAADPRHADDWAALARTYQVMGMAMPVHEAAWRDASGAGPRPLPPVHAPPPPVHAPPAPLDRPSANRPPAKRPRRRAAALVAMAMAACVAVAILPAQLARWTADHVTGHAETAQVTLPDGSRVRLAPDSAIRVDLTGIGRRVSLIEGRAFFEVTADPARPFQVTAGDVSATVLGTAFEVRRGDDDTRIAVREGRVRVARHGGSSPADAVLQAGDWATLGDTGAPRLGHRAARDIAVWTDGQVIARDRPVAEVVDELRPYLTGLVLVRGDDLARQPLTGVYNLTDPLAALRAIASAQHAHIRQITPWIVVMSKD